MRLQTIPLLHSSLITCAHALGLYMASSFIGKHIIFENANVAGHIWLASFSQIWIIMIRSWAVTVDSWSGPRRRRIMYKAGILFLMTSGNIWDLKWKCGHELEAKQLYVPFLRRKYSTCRSLQRPTYWLIVFVLSYHHGAAVFLQPNCSVCRR